MDLDHFWNFVSSFYPEDHVYNWFQFMTSPFLKNYGEEENNEENRLLYDPVESESIPQPHK